jgi:hypothetical protein
MSKERERSAQERINRLILLSILIRVRLTPPHPFGARYCVPVQNGYKPSPFFSSLAHADSAKPRYLYSPQ